MDPPPETIPQRISDDASPPSSSTGDIFKRLSVSPSRNRKLLEKPATRLSPQQRVHTPKRLSSPDILRPTMSLDIYERQRSGPPKINEITFPNSPTKASNALRNLPVIGGDGSLSRIRNRFKVNNTSPVKMNLMEKLSKDETVANGVKSKANSSKPSKEFRIEKSDRQTRSKSVKFELPEDRVISIELNEMKKTNAELLNRIEELELRIAKLEEKLP
ncbi:unnamed protein product [Kluyveromyces dobzhanskii CBS 2104]|uniref:WGS project CCBQ000000000 data, contig 00058 n=1 Tax=Kluyveromyces dobzhanskii CBS 2104 TaxID=1427455 RepID=A0A0A8LB59_9SACH|nr:unnamed protein product [Kluyveromyces dobzhanskii CBS 2104]